MRASALRVHGRDGDLALPGKVELAEISGSDTFVHVAHARSANSSRSSPACTSSTLGAPITLYLNPAQVYVFDADGDLLRRAARTSERRLTWPASNSTWRTPTSPNPQRDEDYALLPLKMTFDDGGAYALLGPSGCGKTTLLNIVSGLVTPSQGSVKFDGVDVTALHAAAAQHRAGVPVPGHLRHDDGGREPRLPAAQPRRRRPTRSSSASARSPRCSR